MTVWNSGGGTLTGSVSVGAPFSIVSGESFRLGPGQPQEIVVRFAPGAAGGYSGSLQISSTGGNQSVALRGGTITVSPANLSYTAFVGSPQEQRITLKNDGAVAATVNVGQMSAPFALRDANIGAIELAGGQTREVWVKFDPAASGSFGGQVQLSLSGACVRWSEVLDGRGQCLEQSVAQGSASVALAGVAHKINISKKKLDFGIAFVNSTEYQRLNINNQGATTVSLTVSATAPFTVVPESSFTLSPGQGREIVISIHPTVTGDISGTVSLISNSVSFEIPVRARAITYEEYTETILGTLNSLTNLGYYGITHVWDNTGIRSRDFLFAGFRNLDRAQLESWLAMAQSWESSPDPEQQEIDPRLREAMDLLNSIEPSVWAEWLQELLNGITENRFEEVYNSLLLQGLDKVERSLMLILNSQDPQDAKALLASLLMQNRFILNQPINPHAPPMALIGEMFGFCLEVVMAYMATVYLNLDLASQFASTFFDRWYHAYVEINKRFGVDTARSFTTKLKDIGNHIKEKYPAGIWLCFTGCKLMQGLSGLLQYAALIRTDVVVGSIEILWNVTRPGDPRDPFDTPWTLIGILGDDGMPFDPAHHHSFFLVERVETERGRIIVVARGDHCSNCSYISHYILGLTWIKGAINILQQQLNRESFIPARGIIIYVFTNRSATGTNQALEGIEQYIQVLQPKVRDSIAILVVRVMPNGTIQYKCIGGGCGMYTPEELKKMACKQATGRAVCVAEPWSETSQPSSPNHGNPESAIIIGEPDWDETEPIDPNSSIEPRCPVCNS
ncbi:MAG: choice-of-anchor D domain-containing protein [Candidatus Bipolaricaulota bacterium]|nr:choice-of-anchor D domain-containing protein [Candidatus Bipolaricaulota bacterium]